MTKPRALLAGSSFSALPILAALKRAGMHVTVCGNLPDDPCHHYADASLYIDYSSKDAMLEAARNGDYDFLVPSTNDDSYLACAWVSETLGRFRGFDTIETTRLLHTKNIFRAFMEKHEFPVPRAAYDGDYAALKCPVLVKPVDSFSGRGVTRIETHAGIQPALAAAQAASRTGQAVVEEFFEGSLHSHSAFFKNREIHTDYFVDEYCTVYPYQVDCSNHPSRLTDALRNAMRAEMMRMCRILGVTDGLMHTQFMTRGDDFRIIETMRRCPGDLYGRLVELSTGCDYMGAFVAPFIGRDYPAVASRHEKFMGRHTISFPKRTPGGDIVFDVPGKHLRYVSLKNHGLPTDAAPYDKTGLFFVEFDTREQMLETAPKFADYVSIDTPEGLTP